MLVFFCFLLYGFCFALYIIHHLLVLSCALVPFGVKVSQAVCRDLAQLSLVMLQILALDPTITTLDGLTEFCEQDRLRELKPVLQAMKDGDSLIRLIDLCVSF